MNVKRKIRGYNLLKECLLILQMLPWNRSIYHIKLGPSHPPAKRMAENQLYAHANMRRFNICMHGDGAGFFFLVARFVVCEDGFVEVVGCIIWFDFEDRVGNYIARLISYLTFWWWMARLLGGIFIHDFSYLSKNGPSVRVFRSVVRGEKKEGARNMEMKEYGTGLWWYR